MDQQYLLNILKSVSSATLSIEEAFEILKHLPFEDLGFARLDHHRILRTGIPEVILGSGKSDKQIIEIARSIYKKTGRFLITRTSKEVFKKLGIKKARFYPDSGCIVAGIKNKKVGNVVILTAGTSDIPVAEEARVTCEFLGSSVVSIYDVGVAGLHRLIEHIDIIRKANVIIVVAGMDGALPSVVAGMVDKPVIGVPTSSGYGTSLGGLTALFAMLNSCVPGIAVMNIDNGFGAACLAHRINTG